MLFPTLCLLLLAAIHVNGQRVCYQPGVDCTWGGGGNGGGWLAAMRESKARAQHGIESTDEERLEQLMDDYACDCCCQTAICSYRDALCGADIVCLITYCYERVLEVASSDESSSDNPQYSAEVLTAALKVQREGAKDELQRLLENLIAMQNNDMRNGDNLYTEVEGPPQSEIQQDRKLDEMLAYPPRQHANFLQY